MMVRRDYSKIDQYLDYLLGDIYPQPEDKGHTALCQEVLDHWLPSIADCRTVLDVGCGQGFAQELFEEHGIAYTGVTLGTDFTVAKRKKKNVFNQDFSFLEFDEDSFDMVFSRHSLEHSPFPILTLMEWKRVAKSYLLLVLPKPEAYTWAGRNHYSMMSATQARFLMERAGWDVVWEDVDSETEFRWLAIKTRGVGFYDDRLESYDATKK